MVWGGAPPPLAEQKAALHAAEQEVMRLHVQLADLDLDAHALPGPSTASVGRDPEPCVPSASGQPPPSQSQVAPALAAEKLLLEETLLPGCVGWSPRAVCQST
jgi:hypothetical protein